MVFVLNPSGDQDSALLTERAIEQNGTATSTTTATATPPITFSAPVSDETGTGTDHDSGYDDDEDVAEPEETEYRKRKRSPVFRKEKGGRAAPAVRPPCISLSDRP